MSTENQELSPLDAMIAQYEANNKPRFEKKEKKEYDLKNYFTTFLEKGVNSGRKEIRILPNGNKSPFDQVHLHVIKVGSEWKKFPCLKHEENLPCPFCETYDELRSTGVASDKELAKKFNPRLFYIAKVIDRDAEDEGVKFWRFPQAYDKTGIFDKINGIMTSLKKDKYVADIDNGRDLSIMINRNSNDVPVVSSITHNDVTPLSEDAAKQAEWLADTRTWRDVYSIKSYDFLEIVVSGGDPVWDKEEKKFVDKNGPKAPVVSDEDSEVTMGLETIKSGIEIAKTADAPKAETAKGKKAKTTDVANTTEEAVDDLPF